MIDNSGADTAPVELANLLINLIVGPTTYYIVGGESDTLRLPQSTGNGGFRELSVPALAFNGRSWEFDPALLMDSPNVCINGISIKTTGPDIGKSSNLADAMAGDFVVDYHDGYANRKVFVLRIGNYFVELTLDQVASIVSKMREMLKHNPDKAEEIIGLQSRIIGLFIKEIKGRQTEVLIGDETPPGIGADLSSLVNQGPALSYLRNQLQSSGSVSEAQGRVEYLAERLKFILVNKAGSISFALPQGEFDLMFGSNVIEVATAALKRSLGLSNHAIVLFQDVQRDTFQIKIQVDAEGITMSRDGKVLTPRIDKSSPSEMIYDLGSVLLTLDTISKKLSIKENVYEEA
ncbi:hypothetical protein KC640_01340 [Candidatus Dojkabacteria bacterium]|uniref:Uncharacterized protein n=1 Tax=Candidatus Dojkabacteria bacterium TaxID=2099670 RepID=A0A955I6Z3_9BACT|nr:hypothetical protein [Candidatus Dojkabacteria bacterium]